MPPPRAATDGSKTFNPCRLFDDADLLGRVHSCLNHNDFRSAIITAFELPSGDNFIYHAIASVNLYQVQAAINAGNANGLHDWYLDDDGNPAGHPPPADIAAYISLFDPSRSAANSLKSFLANAKKDSLRASVAGYLTSKRHLDPSLVIPKRKTSTPHANPASDFWAWSCQALEYVGPHDKTVRIKTSHHVLPVFMHHFGCVCPSYEALEIISKLAEASTGKTIIDMGSGNGYWTLMLRRHKANLSVIAVDNASSKWRTTWIDDTIVTDGVSWLRKRNGAPDAILLMVYPIIGGDFTRRVVESYRGDVIFVAGTQNGNGYTGFKDMMVDEWMQANKDFEKIVQVPLPSFAGKDDALFGFRRRKTTEVR